VPRDPLFFFDWVGTTSEKRPILEVGGCDITDIRILITCAVSIACGADSERTSRSLMLIDDRWHGRLGQTNWIYCTTRYFVTITLLLLSCSFCCWLTALNHFTDVPFSQRTGHWQPSDHYALRMKSRALVMAYITGRDGAFDASHKASCIMYHDSTLRSFPSPPRSAPI
jgi:hypothetical protein